MRADARANRTALIEAARHLYALRGSEVPYNAIAQEAGVGIGTLYRHFPTQQDLVLGIVEKLRDAVLQVCARWQEPMATEPDEAWPQFVADVVGLQMAAYMPRVAEDGDVDAFDPSIASVRDNALDRVGDILDLAKGAGLVDPAVTVERFQLGLAVTTRPLPRSAERLTGDLKPWLTAVYLRGLRPDRPTGQELPDQVASREPVRAGPASSDLVDNARAAP